MISSQGAGNFQLCFSLVNVAFMSIKTRLIQNWASFCQKSLSVIINNSSKRSVNMGLNHSHLDRPLFKSAYQKVNFLISQPKHMLWVLKRTVSMRRFF